MKTVIFDFDGTLADSISIGIEIYNKYAPKYGAEQIEYSELNKLRRLGYKNALKAKNVHLAFVPFIALAITKEMRERVNEIHPYPGIVDELNKLINKGFAIGVLTSNKAELVTRFNKNHDMPHFEFVISEKSLFGKDKALKKMIHRMKLKPEELIYVGDEPRDITGSRKVGLKNIGVTWGLGGKLGFRDAEPDVYVHEVNELADAVFKMYQQKDDATK